MNDSWTRLVVVVVMASLVLTVAQSTPELTGDMLDRKTSSRDILEGATRHRETFARRGPQYSSLGVVQASMQKQKQHYPMTSMIMHSKVKYAAKPKMNQHNESLEKGGGKSAPLSPDPHNVRPIMGTYSKVRMMGSNNDIFAGMKPNPNRWANMKMGMGVQWANMNMGMGVPTGRMMMARVKNGAGGNMRKASNRTKGKGATKGKGQRTKGKGKGAMAPTIPPAVPSSAPRPTRAPIITTPPTFVPSSFPRPTMAPTNSPTLVPTSSPRPTRAPTNLPTLMPTSSTRAPTQVPTTSTPTGSPSLSIAPTYPQCGPGDVDIGEFQLYDVGLGERVRPLVNGTTLVVTEDDLLTVECVPDPPYVDPRFPGIQVGSIRAMDNRENPGGTVENFPPFLLSRAETETDASDFWGLPGEWIVTCVPYCERRAAGEPSNPPRTIVFTVVRADNGTAVSA